MSRMCVRFAAQRSCIGYFFFFALLSAPLLSQAPSTTVNSTSSLSGVQSDPAAIQVMQNVMAQSGGANAWRQLKSAEETFTVLTAGETTPHIVKLLDDWSQDATRYRRKTQGESGPPKDHNGSATFPANTGAIQTTAPEFDQARVLVGLLPAAAAEVMLRRSEYVLKVAKTQSCPQDDVCVDAYETRSSVLQPVPEQQWTISATTWLPIAVRYQITSFGSPRPIWQNVRFLSYATQDQLTIPVLVEMNLAGVRKTWTFVSITKNPEFNTAKFDQEVAQ